MDYAPPRVEGREVVSPRNFVISDTTSPWRPTHRCPPVGKLTKRAPGMRSAAERIPGARLVSFPTGGHLWVGRQGEVVSEITKFLGDTTSRPSTRGGA